MKRMISTLLAAGATVLLAAPAFATGVGIGRGPTKITIAKPNDDPEFQFLLQLHEANQHEIAMARIALANTPTIGVRNFANRLIADHTSADSTVSNRVKAKGWTFAGQATPLSQVDKAAMDTEMQALRMIKGAEFDKQFLSAMIAGHEKLLPVIAEHKEKASGDYHEELSKIFSTVQEHRQMAHELLYPGGERQNTSGTEGNKPHVYDNSDKSEKKSIPDTRERKPD